MEDICGDLQCPTTHIHGMDGDLAMYWWIYYPYAPYYWYPTPYLPDPTYLMMTAFQWVVYPYYYMILFEMYRAIIDTWRKSLELITKSLETKGATSTLKSVE